VNDREHHHSRRDQLDHPKHGITELISLWRRRKTANGNVKKVAGDRDGPKKRKSDKLQLYLPSRFVVVGVEEVVKIYCG
jgi:hypothetical protein